jgi:hypothetical protein
MPVRIAMASQLSEAVMDVAREMLPPGCELIVAELRMVSIATVISSCRTRGY